MGNHYETPEMIEIGRAEEIILGSSKEVENFPDSPAQDFREMITQDDE